MLEFLPQWMRDGIGDDLGFWLAYFTNGAHRQWYAALQYTVLAGLFGGALALFFGIVGASLRLSSLLPLRFVGTVYSGAVRGIPDVLFFLFFPLAFEQTVEWVVATRICSPEMISAQTAPWPPCREANWFLSTWEYLALASVSLGLVYGAFATNVIYGAMRAVPKGQIEAAQAFGLSRRQVLVSIRIRQMWIYALPGLSNVWMLLVKATALLSLLQIADIVLWADRLGAPNFLPAVGLVHPDWRFQYYFALFCFYILVTFLSEKAFGALMRRAGRGMLREAPR